LRIFINPKIIGESKEKVIIYEGCGSIAKGGIFGPVKRSTEVTVEAFDESGKKFTLTTDGLLARVIMHEMDHLSGIEFIQKIDDYSKILDESIYKKTVKKSKNQLETIKITKIKHKNL
jgi:peptide deformylase